MSQQNGFGSGFIIGSIVGGVVGGIIGNALATRNQKPMSQPKNSRLQNGTAVPLASEESIELARHGLEDKIAQLNLAIDDVRQQLGSVQANSLEQE
ncbi:hypothetical protein NIES4102_06130 [Chondrocystis sp. NIES-4102]|nr:hypothetical protein NIES4102_06130 [Chondrocystis sp. NIES-4102]